MQNRFRLLGCGLLATALCQNAFAQENADVVVVDEATVVGEAAVGATAVFYTAVPTNDFQPAAIPFAFDDNPMALIGWPQISDELEIVDEQRQQIQQLQKEMHERMQRTIQDVMQRQKNGEAIDHRQITQQMQQMNQKLKERLNKEILLPHQTDRLKQLGLQMQMRHQGAGGALINQRLATELGITDAQKERLKRAAQEAQAHLRTEMERLQKQAREKVMSELTDSQRQKLNDLLGNPIDLSRPSGLPGAGQ